MRGARVFDELAGRYDSWYSRHPITAENEVKAVAAALGGVDPCLEVGAGSGFFASRVGCRFGVDPSVGMLRIARARGVEVAQARGESLPVASGSLAGILVSVTICFLDDPRAALGEAYRALRPRGRIAVCMVPAESSWGRHYAALARAGHPFYSHARFYTVAEAGEMLEEAGFRVDSVIGTLTYPPWGLERPEDPEPYREGVHGFACLSASKGE
ncbi:class I SAM-dependent methyltransferase [Stetteria hydrogenophila]